MFSLAPLSVDAYETDVHFYLTYVLGILAGLTSDEADLIARADQSMDDNEDTTALSDNPIKILKHGLGPQQPEDPGAKFHSLTGRQDTALVGLKALQCRAGLPKTVDRTHVTQCTAKELNAVRQLNSEKQLVAMGEFLHYYQDTYAHSVPKNDQTANWKPYGPRFGHFFNGHDPDRIPYRLALAKIMAEDSFDSLRLFARLRNETPNLYPTTDLIDALVDIDAEYYPDEATKPAYCRNEPISSGAMPECHPTPSWGSADVNDIRCAFSVALFTYLNFQTAGPDVRYVVYQKANDALAMDGKGELKPGKVVLKVDMDDMNCSNYAGLNQGYDAAEQVKGILDSYDTLPAHFWEPAGRKSP